MIIENKTFTGERALFTSNDLVIKNVTFTDGESPLKESKNITLYNCTFDWKYPLWYCNQINVYDSALTIHARAGIWYTKDIILQNIIIDAPKTFRRCQNITLNHITINNASETLWHCNNVSIDNVTIKGDYFGLNSNFIKAKDLIIDGNYPFDGCKNLEIRNAKLISKDAFWNCENVIVYDSYIQGEYIGWNSKNITFVNCTLESLQGLCYINNLKMINCKLINTTLCFEYSTLDVDIDSSIDSVINPKEGKIVAKHIDKLILENDKIDPSKTIIICKDEKK